MRGRLVPLGEPQPLLLERRRQARAPHGRHDRTAVAGRQPRGPQVGQDVRLVRAQQRALGLRQHDVLAAHHPQGVPPPLEHEALFVEPPYQRMHAHPKDPPPHQGVIRASPSLYSETSSGTAPNPRKTSPLW